jgi:hypothetical protein
MTTVEMTVREKSGTAGGCNDRQLGGRISSSSLPTEVGSRETMREYRSTVSMIAERVIVVG